LLAKYHHLKFQNQAHFAHESITTNAEGLPEILAERTLVDQEDDLFMRIPAMLDPPFVLPSDKVQPKDRNMLRPEKVWFESGPNISLNPNARRQFAAQTRSVPKTGRFYFFDILNKVLKLK